MTSNAFDFFQTDSRQSAEFLNFNQSFLFKRDGENALTRFAELPSEALAKEGRNSPIELKEGQNVRSANSLAKQGKARLRRQFLPDAARSNSRNFADRTEGSTKCSMRQ